MLYIVHPTTVVPFSKDSFKRMKYFLTCLSGIMIALLCELCRVSIVLEPPLVATCDHVIGVSAQWWQHGACDNRGRYRRLIRVSDGRPDLNCVTVVGRYLGALTDQWPVWRRY